MRTRQLIGLRRAFLSNNATKSTHNVVGKVVPGSSSFLGFTARPIRYNLLQACLAAEIKESSKYTGKQKEEDKHLIRKGDTIDLNQLLFTKDRDYLIKNNNEQVKAEQLKGKVIGIYLFNLTHPDYADDFTESIKDVYADLQHDNNFEVVLVAGQKKRKDYSFKHFKKVFSAMPWTAIPFSDVTSRKHLFERFGVQHGDYYDIYSGVTCHGMFVIVDPTGVVLQYDATKLAKLFLEYGAIGYPFSDKRISFLMEEDDAIHKQPSLNALLASPKRDYVISNKGDKVPINNLEDKVVALYFYTRPNKSDRLRDELLLVYDKLAKVEKHFEVVLVFGHESRFLKYDQMACNEFFWEKFKTMPWLALPFADPSCMKLRRIFEIPDNHAFFDGAIVIVGPHAKFIEPLGFDIMQWYEISGYPFTRTKAVEIETEKVKELKLEMLWDTNTLFKRIDGSEVPLCRIAGKRIMLILEKDGTYCYRQCHDSHLEVLKERYLEVKGTDDEFEVIRVLRHTDSFNYKIKFGGFVKTHGNLSAIDGDMVWLFSLVTELRVNLAPYYWCCDIEEIQHFSILAFDQDGSVVRRTCFPTLEGTKFPFCALDLKEQTLSNLNDDLKRTY